MNDIVWPCYNLCGQLPEKYPQNTQKLIAQSDMRVCTMSKSLGSFSVCYLEAQVIWNFAS